ncbi:hypothetical protein ADK93_34875, partial [Streptomyces sp. XY58]
AGVAAAMAAAHSSALRCCGNPSTSSVHGCPHSTHGRTTASTGVTGRWTGSCGGRPGGSCTGGATTSTGRRGGMEPCRTPTAWVGPARRSRGCRP